jgi:hypothetical protein
MPPTPEDASLKRVAATDRAAELAPDEGDVAGRITAIVQEWANAATEPASDATLANLWASSGVAAPFDVAAQDLARRLNEDLGSSLRGSDINDSTTVGDLIQMIV